MRPRITRLALITTVLGAATIAVPHAYVLNGPKWATRQVPYYVNPANSDVPEAAAEAAIQAGAATWSMQSNADFSFYYAGRTSNGSITNNGRNEVFFRNTTNGGLVAETYWWRDSSNRVIDADIIFYDAAYTFATSQTGCSGGVYIEAFAAHEFGHALGLGHSSVASATMNPTGSYCSLDWTYLDPDDLAGVEALYPPRSGSTNTAPSETITAPGPNAAYAEGAQVSFTGSASDQQDGNLTGSIVWSSSLSGQVGVGGTVVSVLPVGSHTITAAVTDSGGLTTTQRISVTVSPATPAATSPPPSGVNLSATGYKIKGAQRVDLSWTGATSATVDVYRNGVRIVTTANDGTQSDALNKKGNGTYTYQLCEAGTSVCSNTARVVF